MLFSQEARTAFNNAKTLHSFGELPEGFAVASVSVSVINGNGDDVIAKINALFETGFF